MQWLMIDCNWIEVPHSRLLIIANTELTTLLNFLNAKKLKKVCGEKEINSSHRQGRSN